MRVGDSEIELRMGPAHPFLMKILPKVGPIAADPAAAIPRIEMQVSIDGVAQTYVMQPGIDMDVSSEMAVYTTRWRGPSWFQD